MQNEIYIGGAYILMFHYGIVKFKKKSKLLLAFVVYGVTKGSFIF